MEAWNQHGMSPGVNRMVIMPEGQSFLTMAMAKLRIFLCLSRLYLDPCHFDDPGVLGTAAGPAALFAIPPQGLQNSSSNPQLVTASVEPGCAC